MSLLKAISRKKKLEEAASLDSNLRRCLGLFDITFLALGQMMGAGIYVLTGTVVRNMAGPSIIFSFLLAGAAALLSAFSYAEFGARFPRAGSAYTYTYVGLGELWAFVVGWTILLEYMIGNAAVARSWSAYFDTLVDNQVENMTVGAFGEFNTAGGFFSRYPDFLACALILLVSVAISLGSRISSNVNSTFVILNIVVSIVVICGATYADFSLWTGTVPNGNYRFMPFGVEGMLSGAATCFFSYIGFEMLATTGEEVKEPRKTIPRATFLCISVVATIYILMSSTLTLMLPYEDVHPRAPFAEAFDAKGATVVRYIITAGALAGMSNNLVAGVFSLPRSVYAMADDGLLFKFLAQVNKKTQVPLNAIIVFTLLNAILTLVFDIDSLVEFLSIGTLFAYSIVSACVLILRYQPAPIGNDYKRLDNGGTLRAWIPFRNFWESLPAGGSISIGVALLVSSFFSFIFALKLELYGSVVGMLLLSLNLLVPFVPFMPCLSLLVNVAMMAHLSYLTWIRLFIWMAIGLIIYFAYGIRHSKEARRLTTIADMRMSSTFSHRNTLKQ
ncbi:unnamed protein product [Caenorhabditis auriculariae]|uniref:Cationic amino acid transporter C-terminal domain-containing protein n=1 Tax=Caenorhabditis auriculariae TaxID=2777116 RepID=A0A8S1H6X0_9PELO|nr:unnamed protein product [Caenorhabditis auriculariae]